MTVEFKFSDYSNQALAAAGDRILYENAAATDSFNQTKTQLFAQILSEIGGLDFQGTWNAATNTPTLTSSTGTKGEYFIVSVAGSTNLDGITDWNIGDFALFSGSVWQKVDNTDSVSTVFGRVGNIVAVSDDYTIAQITNGLSDVLNDTNIFVGNGSNEATGVTMSGEASIANTGAVTLNNAAVIGKVITGFTSGAGAVAATDTILEAIQKLDGNTLALVTGVSSVFGRSGAVLAASDDYTIAQITDGLSDVLTSARIFVGNVSNVAIGVAMSGQATISNTGAVTLQGSPTFTNITGTLQTAAQGNITSLGTLTSLQVDNINLNTNLIASTSGNLALGTPSTSTALTCVNSGGVNIGAGSSATGVGALGVGDGDANANDSLAVGSGTRTVSLSGFVVGRNNIGPSGSLTGWNSNDVLVEFGVGVGGGEARNAFHVYKNSIGAVGLMVAADGVPDGTWHVHTASAGAVTADISANDLIVENNTSGGISILVPDSGSSQIFFGSPSDSVGAIVRWQHNGDLMSIGTNNAGGELIFTTAIFQEAMRIDASQNVAIGIATGGDGTLHVHTATAGIVTAAASADDLVVENNTSGGISILVPDAQSSQIFFGSPSDSAGAIVRWNHNADLMSIGTNNAGGELAFMTAAFVERGRFGASGGLIIGTGVTGGDKGAGTINVGTDIFKNNTAYTNPDYALEHWATGKIVKFIDNDGAKEYEGITPIDELRKFMQTNYFLPGVQKPGDTENGVGSFSRSDRALEKIEEAFIYVVELHDRVSELEAA